MAEASDARAARENIIGWTTKRREAVTAPSGATKCTLKKIGRQMVWQLPSRMNCNSCHTSGNQSVDQQASLAIAHVQRVDKLLPQQ